MESRPHLFAVPAAEVSSLLELLDRNSATLLAQWEGIGELRGGPGNNTGVHVEWFRAIDGTGGPVNARGPWCASVQAAADHWAAVQLGLRVPYKTSRSAKVYTRNVARAGRWVAKPRGPWGVLGVSWSGDPRAGDRVCWHRGDLDRKETRWKGHVARVVTYDRRSDALVVREGNRNNRTDRKGRRFAVVGTRKVYNWRGRLYGIARLYG